jgi:hypothetical protein
MQTARGSTEGVVLGFPYQEIRTTGNNGAVPLESRGRSSPRRGATAAPVRYRVALRLRPPARLRLSPNLCNKFSRTPSFKILKITGSRERQGTEGSWSDLKPLRLFPAR